MTHTQPEKADGWRVGQLADLTGVTVRTLRHYDQTGLLRPAGQTAGGHRLYDRNNVLRLYRVLALRRLRFSLAEIRSLLDDPQWDLASMVARHAEETDRGIAAAARLSAHLRAIAGEIAGSGDASPDTLFGIMEEMSMLDTPIRSTTTLLVYDDLTAAHAYLVDTFGLTSGFLELDPDGRAVHGELFAGDQSIWLHPSGNGYRSPRELGGVSSMIVIAVDDADAHYAFTKEHGADLLGAPVDQPYGVREYGARDFEGHLLVLPQPTRLSMVTDTAARQLALALPEAVEQDHHGFPSFRVAGRIFATLPSSDRLRAMLDEHGIRSAAANWPESCREFYWGKRLACVEIDLGHADESLVRDLLAEAWDHKKPRRL